MKNKFFLEEFSYENSAELTRMIEEHVAITENSSNLKFKNFNVLKTIETETNEGIPFFVSSVIFNFTTEE